MGSSGRTVRDTAPRSYAEQESHQEREREREREAHHNQDRPKERKKTQRGGDLEESAVHDVRVDGEGRVQDEETLGEPQTATRFVFPLHLKRRKESRDDGKKNKNQPNNKKKEKPKNNSHKGRVLKGKTKRTRNLCFRAKTHADPTTQEK